jgi:hypothetical protein
MADSDANTGRADHVHEAALLPHRDGRWWDGSLFAAPSSPLGHFLARPVQRHSATGSVDAPAGGPLAGGLRAEQSDYSGVAICPGR